MTQNKFKSIDSDSISRFEMQSVLSSAIAPRPICFASTVDKEGNVNLSPFSFFNVFSYNPPIMVFSPSRRGRDNTTKHTLENILEVPEATINVVNYAMVEQMSLASTEYEKSTNEFVKAGFSQINSDTIRPPRVGESPVSFECTIDNVIELGDEGGAGNLVIARVNKIHIQTDYLDENDILDTAKLDLVGRMGGSWYTRASGDSLFEIPKPLRTKGVGVDALPQHVQNSSILTGNNLGRLGNVEQLPTEEELNSFRGQVLFAELSNKFNREELQNQLHLLAKEALEQGDISRALLIVFSV